MNEGMNDVVPSGLILITIAIIGLFHFLGIKEMNIFSGIVLFFLTIAWLGTIVRFWKRIKKP